MSYTKKEKDKFYSSITPSSRYDNRQKALLFKGIGISLMLFGLLGILGLI